MVVGVFPTDQPDKMDMIDFDESGRVRELLVRPKGTGLEFCWGVAVWTPVFTEFLHEFVALRDGKAINGTEPSVGNAIQAAIGSGLRVHATRVSETPFIDIGTPEGLAAALKRFSDCV
jgi:glucose-1-phosphate thymidylyltransferase